MFPPVETGFAAFLAGLAVSPHCGLMCAPLTCALGPWKGSDAERTAFASCYHLARGLAYAAAGAVAGALGGAFGRWLDAPSASWLPWGMVVFMLAVAVGMDRGLPLPGPVRRLQAGLMIKAHGAGPMLKGATMGALSPLLPCGPLHYLLGLALLGGSVTKGAEIGLGFAAGTLPLLWAAQTGWRSVLLRLGDKWAVRARRGAAVTAAVVIAARLIWQGGGSGVCL